MSKAAVVQSLFGEFNRAPEFCPLTPLAECEDEKHEWLVDGLISENSYVLLTGVKNTFKTWFGGYLGVCVALGAPCFGRAVKRGTVVYAYGEGAMKRRLRRLVQALGGEPPTNLLPYPLRANLTSKEAREDFLRHIPPDTTLIIIDNFEKFWSSDMDEKVVDAAFRFLDLLRTRVTVILIHHEAKNPPRRASGHARAKGLSKLVNAADSTFSLSRGPGGMVFCEVYHRESEPLEEPIKFRLIEPDNGSIALEEISKLTDSVSQLNGACFSEVRSILLSEMKEPLTKTAIFEKHLKGKGIRGLSTSSFYDSVFPHLLEKQVLRQYEEEGNVYELVSPAF